jgi:hypothetical protein
MRKKRFLIAGLGLAISIVVAGTAISAPAIQTMDVVVGGKSAPKFDKKKYKPTSLQVKTSVSDQANPSGIPPKSDKVVLKFDSKDFKFNTKAVPGCAASALENTSTDAAKSACPKSVIGGGNGVAALPLGAGGARADFPAVVTAFNKSGGSGLLLHARVGPPVNSTVVLSGPIKGTTLTINTPPIASGAGAIASFTAKVNKKDYVQARCTDKKLATTGTFSFTDAPTVTVKDTQKCKQS